MKSIALNLACLAVLAAVLYVAGWLKGITFEHNFKEAEA